MGAEDKFYIRSLFTDWHVADQGTAERYAKFLIKHITAVPKESRADYINRKRIKRMNTEETMGKPERGNT